MAKKRGWSKRENELERKRFELRISQIKTIPFLDAFDIISKGVSWDRQRVPYHLVCPLPDHYERSGSFYLQKHRWFCFGCQRGGDIIDFAQHYHEIDSLPKAIKLVERWLGLLETEDVDDAELAMKATIARQPDKSFSRKEWDALVYQVNDFFLWLTRPFRFCRDPRVREIHDSLAPYIYEDLNLAVLYPPISPRGRREAIRRLRTAARQDYWAIAESVEHMTGKDVLDCALQGDGYPRYRPHVGAHKKSSEKS